MNLQSLLAGIEADLVSAAADGAPALHAEAFAKLAALQLSPEDLEACLLALHEVGEKKQAGFGAPSDSTLRTVALGTLLAAPAMSAVKFLYGKHQKEEGWNNLMSQAPDVVAKDPNRARATYDLLHSTSPHLSGNTPVAADLMRQMLAAPQLDVGTVGRLAQTGKDLRSGDDDSFASTMSEGLKNTPGVMLGVQSLRQGMPMKAAHVTKDGVPTFFNWGSEACKQAGLTDLFMGSGQPMDQANNAFQMQQLDLGQTHLPLDNIIRELLSKETELTQREGILAQQEQQMAQWQQSMSQMGGMYQQQTGVDPATGQPAQDPNAAGGDPSMGGDPSQDPNAAGGDPSQDPSMGGDPAAGGDPSQDPSAAGGDPSMGGDPSQDPSMGGDPAAGGDPSMDPSMGGDPSMDPGAAPPEEGAVPGEGAIEGDPNAAPSGPAGDISDEGSQQTPPPEEGAPSVDDLVQPQGGEIAESGENPGSPVGIDSTPADVAAGEATPGGTVDPQAPPVDGEEAPAGGEAPPMGEEGGEQPPAGGEAPVDGEAPPADGEIPAGAGEGGEEPPAGDGEQAPAGEEGQPPAGDAPMDGGGEPPPADDGMAPPPGSGEGGDVVPPEAGVVSGGEQPPMDPGMGGQPPMSMDAAAPTGMPPAASPPMAGSPMQGTGTATIPVTFTLPVTVSIKVGSARTDFDDAVDQHDAALSKFSSTHLSFLR